MQHRCIHFIWLTFVFVWSIICISVISANTTMAGGELGMDEQSYKWIIRARVLGIFPTDDSSALLPTVSPLLGGPAQVEADENYVPELDITYMLTKHIGAELILGISKHELEAKGTLPLAAPGDVAEAWVLPPTIIFQYHFNPDGQFRPYLGVGINVTFFFEEETKGTLKPLLSKADMDTTVGVALQAGFDYQINDKWFFNADVKYIHMGSETTLSGGALGAAFGPQKFDVEINPIVVGIGIGTRF